jgi:RNA polymerase sigma factor (sigma-70 family)
MSAPTSDTDSRDQTARVAELRPRLIMFFGARTRNVSVDDLASLVTLQVLQHLAQGKGIEDVGAYAFGVARNVLLEHYRNPYERRRTSLDDLIASGREPAAVKDEDEDELARERRCLSTCLASLRPDDRQLIGAFYAEGKNMSNRAALAVRLGVSRNALDQRASKIRTRLRQCAETCLDQDPVSASRATGQSECR